MTAEHREEGSRLQNEVGTFEIELNECIEEIWTRPDDVEAVNPVDKVAKPDLFQGKEMGSYLFGLISVDRQ